MDRERILAGLNTEQRRAVEAVRGPVCILAGAGSGKTTTITRRIAYQIATGAFAAEGILAVTFTDKAATELRERLAALGVPRVPARTFHAAALAQLRHFAPDDGRRILAAKVPLLRQIANRLPRAYRFRPAADLATEIEWAKNRRVAPSAYLGALGGRTPPLPPDLMAGVYAEYERRKAGSGAIDFEDVLEEAIRLLEAEPAALAEVRARYRAFTVDEYQDVNLLQQTLLDRWLGERDDLCAVGDDYQSIYGFTGATPAHLLALPHRFPRATVVRLEENYRSTPQVLALANRLVPRLGGAEKRLRAVAADGPDPVVRSFAEPAAEARWLVERVRELAAEGTALEETAVLCRTNARLADFEEAFHDAEIPFQGAALLEREGARQLLKALARSGGRPASEEVPRAARELGLLVPLPDGLGEREVTRQQDLARLVRLAEAFDEGAGDVEAFVRHLQERFGARAAGRRGVHLLTLHRAKGLEWDAVFLPRLEERELPTRLAKTPSQLAEERRLLYVGLTRARRHLAVTWAGPPSRFLGELGAAPAAARGDAAAAGRRARPAVDDGSPAFAALRAWRRERAKSDGVPAYVVFHDATLAEIAARRPGSMDELAGVAGVGPAKLERYGRDVVAALAGVEG